MTDTALDAAIEAYNKVWQAWSNIDASTVDACRREAMRAALDAAARADVGAGQYGSVDTKIIIRT